MIQGFGQEITEIPAFEHDITEVRAMGELVWQKSIPDYLCFTALESGTFTLTIPAVLSTNGISRLSYIEWSKDGRSWNRTENKNSTEITIPVDVVTGDKVYWRGSGTSMTSASVALTSDCRFTSTARFNASGHLLSLLKLDDYDAITGWSAATFANLFYQATTLIDASGIILPALAAGNAYTFYGTFYECTNLVAAPDFNTSYTGNYMCFQMYRGCTSLTTMPKLPTTLSTSIFSGMFRGCTSLSTAQPLNYTILAENCFANMFNGCSSLAYVKCLATDISATDCLLNWLASASSTGTFIQAEGVEWPRGASGIPTGWVDVEKRTMPTGYKQVEYVANPNKPSATPMPIVETGIVLDPSQDTIEIAVFPHIGDDGYIAHHRYGGLPIANNMSPAQSGAKVGRFYCMYRKIDSANVIQFSWTKATSANSTLTATNKIVETPQVLRIELSSGNNKMLLNGTQVANNSDACDISDPGTETAKLFGINNVGYNWIDPIYYYKHWRNGVLIADYVACVRESDNEPSFYDFVSNTFKVPTRTGFFTAGEEI